MRLYSLAKSRFSLTTLGSQRAVRSFLLWPDTVARLALSVGILTICATNVAQTHALPKANRHSSAHVYFLAGFLGIKSHLDGLEAGVKRHGLPATISSPGDWPDLARSAIEGYRSGRLRSIIIVGYSAGGRSALEMSAQLNAAKVPVKLMITIDGMSGPPVSRNVRKLINLYVQGGFGDAIARPINFSGALQNIPVEGAKIGHFSIIEAKEARLLNYVLAAAASRAPSSAGKSKHAAKAAAATATSE